MVSNVNDTGYNDILVLVMIFLPLYCFSMQCDASEHAVQDHDSRQTLLR